MIFCFGIHNHQPVGNFGWVIERINDEAYRPFFRIISDYPKIKFSLHLSGPLLQWYEENDTATLDLVGGMVARGQVEIISGGFYEPILAAIPRRDRQGQIEKFQKYLRRRFGVRPKGLWLTERVWEPGLAEDLVQAGIEYVVVDDRHFLVTGFQKKDLDRYYVTESNGVYLKIFPIDTRTRALIPFKGTRDIKGYFAWAEREGRRALFYFDDGEKFGGWPGTHDWVYKKGWLGDFLSMLNHLEGKLFEIKTYGEALSLEPGGIAYLPTASYVELEDWALPPLSYREIKDYRSKVEREFSDPSPYIRGGIWKHFLVKYPEANRMHKFMLEMSEELEAESGRLNSRDRERARDALYQAQCNDAYWHGVFGGLYLPHLRHAIWTKLSEVKEILNRRTRKAVKTVEGVWQSGAVVHFDSREVSASWDLKRGGVLSRFLFLRRKVNLLNTLARHEEGYHEKLKDMIRQLRPGVFSTLLEGRVGVPTKAPPPANEVFSYDEDERHAFLDGFFEPDSSQENFERRVLFKPWIREDLVRYRLRGTRLLIEYAWGMWRVTKEVGFLPQAGFQVSYRIRNASRRTARILFGTEINFHMPVPEKRDEPERTQAVSFWDDVTKTLLVIESDRPCGFWHYPIETYHQSESGWEKTYQGTSILPYVDMKLAEDETYQWVMKLTVD